MPSIQLHLIVLAIVTIVSTWLVAFAYRNTKHVLKHKVAIKREAAVTKDMNKELDSGDKKISRKEKDESRRVRSRHFQHLLQQCLVLGHFDRLLLLHFEKFFPCRELRWSYVFGSWSRCFIVHWFSIEHFTKNAFS